MPKIVHNKHFISALGILLLSVTFYVFVIDCGRRALLDFEVYRAAARALISGDNIYAKSYEVIDRWDRQISLYYLYPPLLAQLLSKFSNFDQSSMKFGWCVLSFLCTTASAYCIAQLISFSWWMKLPASQRFFAVFFFCVCFEPVFWGVSDGQVTAIVLLLLAVFLLALLRDKQMAAGIALALAVLIKISPIILVLALLRFRRWNALVAFVLTCATALLWTYVDLGNVHIFADFINSLSAITQDRSSRGFLFNYVFDKSILSPLGLESSEVARCIVRAVLVAMPVMVVLNAKNRDRISELRTAATLICFMMACSPIIWFHHLAWALLPLAVLSCGNEPNSELRLKHLTACVGLYFALSQVNLIHYWTFKEFPDLTWISSLIPTVLLLLLAYLLQHCKLNDDAKSL